MNIRSTLLLVMLVVMFVLPARADAETNILFILDGSNSMWGQIDEEAKITSAQEVIKDLLKDLPENVNTGLMAYGHTKEASCEDIEILSAIGSENAKDMASKIDAIQPKGKTPIAGALQKSLDVLAKHEGDSNNVVLISDGVESCDGDPCAAAKALADAGINARVHVVGFDVGQDEREQLECIPEMGNGKYYSAANASELKIAAQEVKKETVKEPPKPVVTTWLDENFDGTNLPENWEVINPNPAEYIVEKSNVLSINSTPAKLTSEEVKNIFRLIKPLPEGDWIATSQMTVDFQTGRERIYFGLFEDHENYLVNQIGTDYDINRHRHELGMHPQKVSGGQVTDNEIFVWRGEKSSREDINASLQSAMPILMRLEKKGREYTPSVKLTGVEDAEWFEAPPLKLLRQTGNIAFGVYQNRDISGGETAIKVDWVKIETISKPKAEQE